MIGVLLTSRSATTSPDGPRKCHAPRLGRYHLVSRNDGGLGSGLISRAICGANVSGIRALKGRIGTFPLFGRGYGRNPPTQRATPEAG